MDRGTKLAAGSIAIGLLVLGLKYWAYMLTGSVALFSDAMESIVNVAASVAAFFAVRLSAIPSRQLTVETAFLRRASYLCRRAVQLQAISNQLVPKALHDLRLHFFDLGASEFNNIAGG